ncbi:MAG TPA: CHAD domain-containing protein [Chthoniobacterales bacterium]|nr:CHAD domain-containing protein [Chthoniobacterales bacterium]
MRRKESLRKGLKRISQRRLDHVLRIIAHDGPTTESVHEVRKIVKSLRAILRLARGAVSTETRKERNQVLRDFAGKFSRQRDAAVTLDTLEKVSSVSLNGKRELRKRVKDLGYQLALHKKLEGVKPKLAKLGKVGDALGDASDLILLRSFISRLPEKSFPAERKSCDRVLTFIDGRRHQLYQQALQVGRRVYSRGSKRFARRMAKRWRRWKGSY